MYFNTGTVLFQTPSPLHGDEKNRVRSTRISFRNDDASRNKNVRRMNADEAFDKSNRVHPRNGINGISACLSLKMC